MPWLLLLLLVGFSQAAIWGNLYSYRHLKSTGAEVRFGIADQSGGHANCNDLVAGKVPGRLRNADPSVVQALIAQCNQTSTQQQLQKRLQDTYQNFTAPGSLLYILQKSQVFVVLLATILGASLIGSEYGLGTLRPILASGTGRWQYLAAKLVLMAVVVAGALAILTSTSYLASLGARAIESASPGGAAASTWGGVAGAFAKDWFSLLPDIGLIAFVTVLVGSTASGLAIGLGYYFAELVLVVLFSPFSWFDSIANYLLGRAMAGWNGGGPFNSNNIAVPGNLQSIFVLAVYSLVLGGLAFAVFVRRDVQGTVGS
jgi:ABC-type transport system involved in multi-copper enzyme maturation permease subunit